MIRRAAILIVLALSATTMHGIMANDAEAWRRLYPPHEGQSAHRGTNHFEYCFVSGFDANARARFKDGIRSWTTRVPGLSASDTGATGNACGTSSAVHIILLNAGDTGLIAGTDSTSSTNLGFGPPTAFFQRPRRVWFNSQHQWWTATNHPWCDSHLDLWGVAAHELGHVFGLDHPGSRLSPQNELATLATYSDAPKSCPSGGMQQAAQMRTLSSDDEAGGQYFATRNALLDGGSYMPNPSFENWTDTVSPIETVSSWYWQTFGSGVSRPCGTGTHYNGNCSLQVSATGTGGASQIVRRKLCEGELVLGACRTTLSVRVQHVGASTDPAAQILLRIENLTTGSMLAEATCAAAPVSVTSSAWRYCSVDTVAANPRDAEDRFRYTLQKLNATSSAVRLDVVRVEDTTLSANWSMF